MITSKREHVSRIHRAKVPSFVKHEEFIMPKSNRYFDKISKNPHHFSMELGHWAQ